MVSKIIYYLCFDHLDTEEKKTDIEIKAIMEPIGDAQIVVKEKMQSASNQKMDTCGEEKLSNTDDAEIIVQLERDKDRKWKRAHKDVVRNNLSISSHILTHKYLYNKITDILSIEHNIFHSCSFYLQYFFMQPYCIVPCYKVWLFCSTSCTHVYHVFI